MRSFVLPAIVFLSGLAAAACQKVETESTVKTLDNFTAGHRDNVNVCEAAPDIQTSREVKPRVDHLLKGLAYKGAAQRQSALTEDLRRALSAVPPPMLDLYAGMGGTFLIASAQRANETCALTAKRAMDAVAAKLKRQELDALREGMALIDHCYVFVPPTEKEKNPLLTIVLSDAVTPEGSSVVQHGTVHAFGYLMATLLPHVTADRGKFTYSPKANPTLRKGVMAPLTKAFLADVKERHENRYRYFAKYGRAGVDRGDLEQFQNFVFAEAFDSYHCNNWADNPRKNTLTTMMSSFPKTWKAFLRLYSMKKVGLELLADEPQATDLAREAAWAEAAPADDGAGLALQGEAAGEESGGWFSGLSQGASDYWNAFSDNASAAASWTAQTASSVGTMAVDTASNVASAVGTGYQNYSNAVSERVNNVVDNMVASDPSRQLSTLDLASAAFQGAGDQIGDSAGTLYGRIDTTRQGIAKTMEEANGGEPIGLYDQASALTYAGLTHAGAAVTGGNTAMSFAQAIGGGAYDVDADGAVIGARALSNEERLQAATDGAKSGAVELAFAAVPGVVRGVKGANKIDDVADVAGAAAREADDLARVGRGFDELAAVSDDAARLGGGTDDLARAGGMTDDAARGGTVADNAAGVACLTTCDPNAPIRYVDSRGAQREYLPSPDERRALANGNAYLDDNGHVIHELSPSVKRQFDDLAKTDPVAAANQRRWESLDQQWRDPRADYNMSYQTDNVIAKLKEKGVDLGGESGEGYLREGVKKWMDNKLAANPAYKFGDDDAVLAMKEITGGGVDATNGFAQMKVSNDFKRGYWFTDDIRVQNPPPYRPGPKATIVRTGDAKEPLTTTVPLGPRR
jgi:hypothetical protein